MYVSARTISDLGFCKLFIHVPRTKRVPDEEPLLRNFKANLCYHSWTSGIQPEKISLEALYCLLILGCKILLAFCNLTVLIKFTPLFYKGIFSHSSSWLLRKTRFKFYPSQISSSGDYFISTHSVLYSIFVMLQLTKFSFCCKAT